MPSFSAQERLRYAFDNFMSRGTWALLGGLALVSAGLIFAVSLFIMVAGVAPVEEGQAAPGLLSLAWASLMHTLDTGTVGGDNGSGWYIGAMFVATIGGLFTVSTLIGILNNALEEKLDALRKGRSRVIEEGHTVILGWAPQIFPIISELISANENQRDACIVILADKDKVEMEEALGDKIAELKTTRLVCRSGSPIDIGDLEIASLGSARSIIVLGDESEEPDSGVIKTLLAILHNPKRRKEPYHIVAEFQEAANLEVAQMISKGEAELVWVGGLISRIIAQTCRQSGLSQVYTELLSFQGEEIYFKAEPSLAGKAFGEVLLAYEKCSVLGLQRASGEVRLLPPMDARVEAGDKVIVVAQDDDAIQLSNRADVGVKAELLQAPVAREAQPERTLVLGWNWRVTSILRELDQYIAPGSEALVVADVEEDEAQRTLDELAADLEHQTVRFQRGDTTHRRTLDGLQVSGFDHIILLCYSDTLDVQRADASTLVTLLHLRDLADRAGRSFAIVSEMLDLRNRALAEVAKVDDFIVSERLISLMLAQVAENKNLNAVFADLFDPEGAEVYLKPAGHYVALGQPVNFYTVVEAARRRGECALGYRLAAHAQEADKSYGVTLNPDKSRAVSFGPLDKVVVLAES